MKNPKSIILYLTISLIFFIIPFGTFAQKIPVSKKLKTDPEYTIDLYSAYKSAKTHPLSTIAKSIEYIPLETTSECLLANAANISITNTDILIFVYEDKCFRFNREGKFLNTIGSVGRGPKEFTKARGCVVDTINNWVYIVDWDKIVKFDFEGNFISRYPLGEKGTLGFPVLLVESGLFLFGNSSYQNAKPGQRFPLYFFSEQNKKYISRVASEKKDKIPFSVCFPSLYNYKQQTFLRGFWCDTVYKVKTPHTLEPYIVFDFGKFNFRKTEDKSITGGKNTNDSWVMEISNIAENNRFVFVNTNKGIFCYDKMEKLTFCVSHTKLENRWIDFNNDITSLHFRLLTNAPNAINNNVLLSHNNAFEFFEEGVDTNNPQIKKLMKTLQPDDNPVLVLVKLKQ